MLQVTIHHGEDFTSGLFPPSDHGPGQSTFMSAPDDPQARVCADHGVSHFPCPIRAIVIDDNDLEREAGFSQHFIGQLDY